MSIFFDVIVIGGGHAGVEASCVSARLGVKTLLITDNVKTIGKMSCNPAIGGVGKGHLVKEIDAFGGLMGVAADYAGVFFKVLNSSKGYAAHSTRVQVVPVFYKTVITNLLCKLINIYVFEGTVDTIIIRNGSIQGVIMLCGMRLYASSVIVATGTFLNGVARVGEFSYSCGRVGDKTSNLLFRNLRKIFTNVCRFRTGTPPRVCRRTINFRSVLKQQGDEPISFFSSVISRSLLKQKSCYLTETNMRTHEIIHNALYKTAAYKGKSVAFGPRYCLSIEDKILRFSKEKHQIFLEYDGINLDDIYLNGLSTSASLMVQYKMLRSIRGLDDVKINFPGYLVEYDCFDPKDLSRFLETKISGLFFAGQINGTTGYEEAAAQGLICGINAARVISNRSLFVPKKCTTFLGVLVEDLTTNGVIEPYRMFISRAENRVNLREDNVRTRVLNMCKNFDLVSKRCLFFLIKIQTILTFCWKSTEPGFVKNTIILDLNTKKNNFVAIILMRVCGFSVIKKLGWFCFLFKTDVVRLLSILIQYTIHCSKKKIDVYTYDYLLHYCNFKIISSFNYFFVEGLSFEAKEKLSIAMPHSIKQVSCVMGITAVDVNLLVKHIRATRL